MMAIKIKFISWTENRTGMSTVSFPNSIHLNHADFHNGTGSENNGHFTKGTKESHVNYDFFVELSCYSWKRVNLSVQTNAWA